jgi:hypothetical protein
MNIPLPTNHRTSRNYYQSSRQIFTTDSPITDLQCPRCPSYTERYLFKPSTSPHSEVVSLRYFPCQRDNKTTKLHRPSLLSLPSQKPLTSFTKISRETTHILHLLRAIPPLVTTSHIKIFRPSTNFDPIAPLNTPPMTAPSTKHTVSPALLESPIRNKLNANTSTPAVQRQETSVPNPLDPVPLCNSTRRCKPKGTQRQHIRDRGASPRGQKNTARSQRLTASHGVMRACKSSSTLLHCNMQVRHARWMQEHVSTSLSEQSKKSGDEEYG